MKKKICIVTTVSLTIRAFLLDTIEYLQKNGYEITIICDEDSNLRDVLPREVKYLPLKMSRGIKINELLPNIMKLVKVFKREKFELVQYSTPNASLYTSIAAFISKVPVRLYCQWGIVYVGFTGIKRYIFKMIEKLICMLSTKIEPDSFGNLKFSQKEKLYKKNKSYVVWNGSASGVDLNKFDISNKKVWNDEIREKYEIGINDFVFGFVGRINKDKGINELLNAYKKICEEKENVKLIIVGSDEKDKGINEEVYEWSINEKSVIYCGKTSNIEKYYSAMDTFILPSYREGFGSVVIEAEAMGVPVIVSDIPGPAEAMINQKTGLVVQKQNIDELYNTMIKLLDNKQLVSKLGSNGRKFVSERFDKKILLNHILLDRDNLIHESRYKYKRI